MSLLPSKVGIFAGSLALFTVVGCGYSGTFVAVSTPASAKSNNWELSTSAITMGSSPESLTDLSGAIVETGAAQGTGNYTTAIFDATAGCYIASETVPMDGTIAGSTLQLRSFGVRGQYLSVSGQLDSTSSHMTGTYKVDGGCSNGESGNFVGVRYTSLTGTYKGSVTTLGMPRDITLVVSQSAYSTGEGSFLLAGNSSFNNFPCFSSGTISAQESSISGSKFSLGVKATDGSEVLLSGSIDSEAKTMNVSSFVVTSGNCSGSFGSFVLNLES